MKKILISLLLGVFLFAGAQASAEYITVYEGSGSVEIGGKVAKFIRDKLGIEVRFTSESHGVIHSEEDACVSLAGRATASPGFHHRHLSQRRGSMGSRDGSSHYLGQYRC